MQEMNVKVKINVRKMIRKLVKDKNISSKSWEKKYQHLRDDLCMVEEGKLTFNECAEFHKNIHNINVWKLAMRYNVVQIGDDKK